MHCNGKCHLRKQLAEQEKRDKSPFSQNLKDELQVQYCSTENLFHYFTPAKETPPNLYSFFIPNTSLQSIFHPPKQGTILI